MWLVGAVESVSCRVRVGADGYPIYVCGQVCGPLARFGLTHVLSRYVSTFRFLEAPDMRGALDWSGQVTQLLFNLQNGNVQLFITPEAWVMLHVW